MSKIERSLLHFQREVHPRSAGSHPTHDLPGPHDITRLELPNGIVFLGRANFNSPSVVVSGLLRAGALFDPVEKLGLADFTASALMRGAGERSFQQIYDALETAGASLGFFSGTHSTSFNGKALVEDLDLLLDLIAQALTQPVFPLEQVERLRSQMLTALAMRAQDTGEMASMAFDELVYQDHPYRHPEDGYPETIQAIQSSDLADFHRRYFGPRGMILAITGSVDPLLAAEKAAATLGSWLNPEQAPLPELPPVKPLEQTTIQRITIAGKYQSDLIAGAAGPSRTSPDYLPALLGNSILGQFGMMGRLGEAVREQAGLAYYASSSLGGGPGPGPWDATAGVDPQNVDQTIDLILQEIRRFTSEPVTPEELSDNQANFTGRLPLSLESNNGVASALINLERYQLGLDYYQRYPERIAAVTAEQILEAARRNLDPDRLAIAVAGP